MRVAHEAAVDGVGQLSLQASQCFPVAFPSGAFALVVGAAGGVMADLGDSHDVQTAVELAVSGAGQPVADDITRGHLDGRAAPAASMSATLMCATAATMV